MFIPHTDEDREEMLKTIGVRAIADLFEDVPARYRFPDLNIPPALTEMEAQAEMQGIAAANDTARGMACFLGAGAYNHYSPAAVDSLLRRGEFYTAYTPYQPEVAQGTLQAIFEYQSQITALTAMDVSNASHYDGATAVAEAVTMAIAHFRGKRNQIILSPAIHPHYRETVHTYTADSNIEILTPALDGGVGAISQLLATQGKNVALVVVQYPDFLGRVYDYTQLSADVHAAGALLAISVNPIALGLLKPPGEMGADIATGEGQPLGIPLSFGGPYLGIFATRNEYVRKMAGRLVGETVDTRTGERAYVLTLTAREQHIRREKATSNICTNVALIALASSIYMSVVGKHGLRKVAELCYHKAHYAAEEIAALAGYELAFTAPFFNEFVVRCPRPVAEINDHLLEHGILGGYDLGLDYPELANHMLIAVTEMNTRDEIDLLVEVLGEMEDGSEVSHG